MADEVAPSEPVESAELAEPAEPEPVEPAKPEPVEPEPPAEPVEPPAEPPAAAEAQPRRRSAVLAGWGALALVLLAILVTVVAVVVNHHGPEQSLRAEQGDCLSGESDSDLKRVSCADAAVKWTVVSVVQNKTEDEAKQKACAPWPQAAASYWESRNGKTGFVLCLAAVPGK